MLALLPRRSRRVALAVAAVPAAAVLLALGFASSAATAKPPKGTTTLCNYYYEWLGKVRFPLQPDPHATYTYVVPSNQAGSDGIGFLVQGQFIHGAWTSWMTYTGAAQPFSVANFVNNPPNNTNNPIAANAGSVDPFTVSQPMLGTPRNFTLLFTPAGYTGATAASLAGVPTSSINPANIKNYPTPGHGNTGKHWLLANRDYMALPGYNPGGTTKSTFPTVTAVNLATGAPVDCQTYNQIPDRFQTPPTNPPSSLNFGRIPTRITLKNGSFFSGLGDGQQTGLSQFSPPNPRGLVLFTRVSPAPGADVATIPPPDNCAGYLGSSLNPGVISLIRIPHIANYTNTTNVTSSTTYPNPANPNQPWQTAYESLVQYGAATGLYLPGSPNTTTIADAQFKVDRTDGSTLVVWPRNLSRLAQKRVFAYAHRHGWAIIRGGQQGRQTGSNLLMRVKASASNYYGRTSAVPCFYGTPQNPMNTGLPWKDVPVNTGSKYIASPTNMGTPGSHGGVISAAPQGVTCRSVRNLTSGRCLARLKRYIRSTGGSYHAPSP